MFLTKLLSLQFFEIEDHEKNTKLVVPDNRDANGGNHGNNDAVKVGQRAAGYGDVSKEPRKGYGQRKNDGTHDAKAVDSSNGKAAFKKSKVAPKKKSQPE